MSNGEGGKPSFSVFVASIAVILLLAGLGMLFVSRIMSGRQKAKAEKSVSVQVGELSSKENEDSQNEENQTVAEEEQEEQFSPVNEEQNENQNEGENTSGKETEASDTPELPDVVGQAYSAAEERILSADSSPELEFQFDETVNRGCVLGLSWENRHLTVTLSAGRTSGFYCMRKRFADGSTDYLDVYYCDELGRHTQAYKYNGNGDLVYTFDFEYNNCGQEIGQRFYLPDGSFHHRWTFEYDACGRLAAEYKYDVNGGELSHSEFKYGSDGRMKEKKDYMNGGLAYIWKMSEYDQSATPLTYYTHMYGNWTAATITDGNGNAIRSGRQSFDLDGNVKSYEVYEKSGELVYEYEFESAPISEINELSDNIINH